MSRRSREAFCSQTIDYYDADKEENVSIVMQWRAKFKTPIEETSKLLSATYVVQEHYDYQQLHVIEEYCTEFHIEIVGDRDMELLVKEAKELEGKGGFGMYLQQAMHSKKSVDGLTSAECLVVTMYTTDFYIEYNEASKNIDGKPYRAYTTLLMSALRKLAKIYPMPKGQRLYRGIKGNLNPPEVRRILWKKFTSTSLDIKVAEAFSGENGTIFVFEPPISKYAAPIWELSEYPNEQEVLLLPFLTYYYIRHETKGSRRCMFFSFFEKR